MVVSCTAPPTWRRVCVVSTFVVMLISWGVGGYDVGAGAGTDVHCRGRNLAHLVLRHAPPSGSHPPPMTNFVVGAVLARAALSFWLSTVIFAGDQFGVGCCAHVAWCALWLSWGVLVHKPYHCHRGFVLVVDGGAGGGRPSSRPTWSYRPAVTCRARSPRTVRGALRVVVLLVVAACHFHRVLFVPWSPS